MIKYILLLFAVFIFYGASGQDDIRTYSFKSGEVLDILLLNLNAESDSLKKVYFNEAIPIAIQSGYKPSKSFAIKDSPLQGNYHPQFMIVASWPSEAVRQKCYGELIEKVDGFHQMRRDIWTNFNVAYYPLREDLSFNVDMSRYNVATAYWQKKDESMSDFISNWKQLMHDFNGQMIVDLTDVKSTFGYIYTPEHYMITSWESKEQFERFKKENLKMNHDNVEQVHQFRIQ